MSRIITEGAMLHGSLGSIGATALQLTATGVRLYRGITIKAGPGNTAILYVGNSNVTANTTAATDGFPLSAGDTVTIEIDDASKVWIIASDVGQAAFWIGA